MATRTQKIMTPHLITVPIGASLSEAQILMKNQQIRHLPVVGKEGDVVGILSQKDLSSISDSKVIPVEVVMHSPVHSVRQDLSLRKAILEMLHLKISSLLITNEKSDVVGILTTDDLLNYLAHLLDQEKEESRSALDPMNLQTIGEIANQISMLGI
jgi:CBS domain-containing protein